MHQPSLRSRLRRLLWLCLVFPLILTLSACGSTNAQTGKVNWNVHIGRYAFACAWSPDGQKVAGGAADGTVSILNTANGKQLATFAHQTGFIEGIFGNHKHNFIFYS